jgi:hypothetical protein
MVSVLRSYHWLSYSQALLRTCVSHRILTINSTTADTCSPYIHSSNAVMLQHTPGSYWMEVSSHHSSAAHHPVAYQSCHHDHEVLGLWTYPVFYSPTSLISFHTAFLHTLYCNHNGCHTGSVLVAAVPNRLHKRWVIVKDRERKLITLARDATERGISIPSHLQTSSPSRHLLQV